MTELQVVLENSSGKIFQGRGNLIKLVNPFYSTSRQRICKRREKREARNGVRGGHHLVTKGAKRLTGNHHSPPPFKFLTDKPLLSINPIITT